MKREIKITTDKKKFFRQYVEVIRPFIGVSSKRTLDVLSLLLYHNDQKKSITNLKDRWIVLFDYDVRMEIVQELKITMNIFNNQLLELRKKGLIKAGNKLDESILVYPEDSLELSIQFTIK